MLLQIFVNRRTSSLAEQSTSGPTQRHLEDPYEVQTSQVVLSLLELMIRDDGPMKILRLDL